MEESKSDSSGKYRQASVGTPACSGGVRCVVGGEGAGKAPGGGIGWTVRLHSQRVDGGKAGGGPGQQLLKAAAMVYFQVISLLPTKPS